MNRDRKAPVLFSGFVPEAQQQAFQLIGHALDNLGYYATAFEAALRLFDFSQLKLRKAKGKAWQRYRQWQFIAARDGGMCIYHFGYQLHAIPACLDECSSYARYVSTSKANDVKGKFYRAFPNMRAVRHSIGHAGDKSRSRESHNAHGFTGTFRKHGLNLRRVKKFVLTDHLYRRAFCNTYNGKIEVYFITQKSHSELVSIRNSMFDLFEQAEPAIRRETAIH